MENLWKILYVLIGVMFLVTFYLFEKTKRGLIRRIFMSTSFVIAYYFISIVVYYNSGVDMNLIRVCAGLPVFGVLLTCLYLIKKYIESGRKEVIRINTEKIKLKNKKIAEKNETNHLTNVEDAEKNAVSVKKIKSRYSAE